jgi:hypothetical protein
MRDGLVKALLVIFMLAAPCLAQTRDELRRKYGEPETLSHKSSRILIERYEVLPGIIMTVKFGDRTHACELRVEPLRTELSNARRTEVMKADEAAMITEELSPLLERGRLIKSLNVERGCSPVVYNEYERVMIVVIKGCVQEGGGVQSVTIRWKDRACEQIDRKGGATEAAGALE